MPSYALNIKHSSRLQSYFVCLGRGRCNRSPDVCMASLQSWRSFKHRLKYDWFLGLFLKHYFVFYWLLLFGFRYKNICITDLLTSDYAIIYIWVTKIYGICSQGFRFLCLQHGLPGLVFPGFPVITMRNWTSLNLDAFLLHDT